MASTRRKAAFLASAAALAALVLAAVLLLRAEPEPQERDVFEAVRPPTVGMWLTRGELRRLPVSGPAWRQVVSFAEAPLGEADLSDLDSDHDVRTLAAAIAYTKTGNRGYREKAAEGIYSAIETEGGGSALALARNLVSYIVAADLISLRELDPADEEEFRSWLSTVRHEELEGRTLVSTHETRPNNWGTHAGASRVAAALYLGDQTDLERAALVFRGYLGERSAYAGFEYGELSWQENPDRPVGINRHGATKAGHDVDGVMPDDQRRSGTFRWPPPCENYVREALQGAVVQAELLARAGYEAWKWADRALLRAARWFHEVAGCPFEGDDEWQPVLINARYGTDLPTRTPASHGKNMGFVDYTHAR